MKYSSGSSLINGKKRNDNKITSVSKRCDGIFRSMFEALLLIGEFYCSK
jgi:hypothetical protein